MMVLSGSEGPARSTGAGRYRSAAKSSASNSAPTKTKYRMIGMDGRLHKESGIGGAGADTGGPLCSSGPPARIQSIS